MVLGIDLSLFVSSMPFVYMMVLSDIALIVIELINWFQMKCLVYCYCELLENYSDMFLPEER